jgi:hypothetical protein
VRGMDGGGALSSSHGSLRKVQARSRRSHIHDNVRCYFVKEVVRKNARNRSRVTEFLCTRCSQTKCSPPYRSCTPFGDFRKSLKRSCGIAALEWVPRSDTSPRLVCRFAT